MGEPRFWKALRAHDASGVFVTAFVLLMAVAAAGQDGLSPPATTRSDPGLVRIDVSVTGDDGKPATGLSWRDFSVSVEGRRRRVVVAEYVPAVRPLRPPSLSTRFSTNAASEEQATGYYVLGFEPESGDRDGNPHSIKIEVQGRAESQVRFSGEFTGFPEHAGPDEYLLAEMLCAPLLATDIRIRLAAFTLKDSESEKLRILVAAEIDRSSNPDGRLALAYVLSDEKGRAVGRRADPDVKAPLHSHTRAQTYTSFILTEAAGPHTLKLAVLDDKGRRGSVEHAFHAALTPVGPLHAADLVLAAERAGSATDRPVVSSELTSGIIRPYLELYSAAADALENTTVIFEVAPNEQARALDGAAGRAQPSPASGSNRRAIEGTLPTTLLAPGEYIIRAVVTADGSRIGQIARPFRVGKATAEVVTPAATIGLRRSSSKPVVVPFTSRPERFERASVLTPQVVGFFMDRLNLPERGESNAAPAVEHARAGRFDDAIQALTSRSGTVPSTFLSGLALYARGELEQAAARFREALRMDSEFFPAAFYLGSCYAAGGRDQDAVGAWQLSLVTESDALFIYTLLGDALLRLHEPDQALAILHEAASAWPDDEQVQVRLGAAYATAGKRSDALEKLEPYLDKHPEDHERHFMALRTLYEARAAGKPVRSTAEDRALFAKWATAYAKAKGPQQAVVDQWQRAMGR
jgi:tetratricopeptide (TPR) repeat protein